MSGWKGDYLPGATVFFTFTTVNSSGVPTQLSGSPASAVYATGQASAATAGITMVANFASTVGLNSISINTGADSGFYAPAQDYAVVLTSGNVGGSTGTVITGYTLGTFSLSNHNIRANLIQVNGATAATSSAQLGVNVVTWEGDAPSRLQSGLVQVAVLSGIVNANLTTWLGNPPAVLQNGLVAIAIVSGAPTGVNGNVNGSVNNILSTPINANLIQWAGVGVSGPSPDVIFTATGTAQSGASASTITLASGTLGVDNIYQNETIFIRSGGGAGESANISTYIAATKVATIVGTWAIQPGSGSGYTIVALGPVAATVGGTVNANVIQVSGTAVQAASGFLQTNLAQWEGVAPLALTAGLLVQASAAASVSGTVNANVIQVLGTAVTGNSGFLQTNPVQIQGVAPTIEADGRLTVAIVSGLVNSNVTLWQGAVPNALQNGLVQVAVLSGASSGNITTINGQAVTANSGFLQVNTAQITGIAPTMQAGAITAAIVSGAATGVLTTVNANVTQINGAATVTSSAQFGVNLVTWEGDPPNRLQSGLVQVAAVSGAATSVGITGIGNVAGSVLGSVNSVATIVAANAQQIQGVAINNLISGRVDSITNQMGANTIQTSTFNAGALTTTVFVANFLTSALVDITAENAIADALLDRANAIEAGLTPRQAIRLDAAAAGGVTSGAGTTGFHILGAGVGTARVSAATDQSGNRLAVTLTL